MFIALVSAVVGAILGAYLTKLWAPNPAAEITSLRRQVAQFQERIDAFEAERAAQKQEDELWISKYENAASQVVKVGPALMIRSPEGDSFMPLYGLIFPDPHTKTRIQTFLVKPESGFTSFSMKMLSAEQLPFGKS